jgi:selenide,water dikinase
VLAALPPIDDERLLTSGAAFGDAGVFRLSDELALVQSVDYFTPIVDDPFDFGRIAAVNALSDIYAVGARPITALAVCAFPADTLPLDVLQRTLAGGLAALAEDDVLPLGGHTIKGPEYNYGLAVTGVVHPGRVLGNAGARPGDGLVLTKPVGTGVLSTALKRGRLAAVHERTLVASMATSNRTAAAACRAADAHAVTDVTGFGLLGHALELAAASGVALEIAAGAVPLLPGARAAAEAGAIPAGLVANREWAMRSTIARGVDDITLALLCDPQTSGGLLASVAGGQENVLIEACAARGLHAAWIGSVVGGPAGTATIRSD